MNARRSSVAVLVAILVLLSLQGINKDKSSHSELTQATGQGVSIAATATMEAKMKVHEVVIMQFTRFKKSVGFTPTCIAKSSLCLLRIPWFGTKLLSQLYTTWLDEMWFRLEGGGTYLGAFP